MSESDSRAPRIADFDPTLRVKRVEYHEELERLQLELLRLQVRMRDEESAAAVVVVEGVDAGGKGGTIARLAGHLDPRGVRVHAIGAPTPLELLGHYMQRFHARMPRRGRIAVFDRSWYGRVLVERVEGLTPRADWQRAYREIREFERHYADDGIAVLKLWLHVSPEEQLRRFEERADDPFKRYKLTDEDWRNRQHWEAYVAAADEMFERTHTEDAPWVLISGENKRHARVEVLRAVRDHMLLRCASLDDWSEGADGLSALQAAMDGS